MRVSEQFDLVNAARMYEYVVTFQLCGDAEERAYAVTDLERLAWHEYLAAVEWCNDNAPFVDYEEGWPRVRAYRFGAMMCEGWPLSEDYADDYVRHMEDEEHQPQGVTLHPGARALL